MNADLADFADFADKRGLKKGVKQRGLIPKAGQHKT